MRCLPIWQADKLCARAQGGAGFIREHIAKNGHEYVGGYAIGSEGNIPAFDYSEKDSEGVWMAQKQWLYYSLWGRLLYDPTTPDTTFAAMFDARYHLSGSPAADGGTLWEATQLVSIVVLRICSFVYNTSAPCSFLFCVSSACVA